MYNYEMKYCPILFKGSETYEHRDITDALSETQLIEQLYKSSRKQQKKTFNSSKPSSPDILSFTICIILLTYNANFLNYATVWVICSPEQVLSSSTPVRGHLGDSIRCFDCCSINADL